MIAKMSLTSVIFSDILDKSAFLTNIDGAGDENRTHNKSLGSSRFTTKLRPHDALPLPTIHVKSGSRTMLLYHNKQFEAKCQLFLNLTFKHLHSTRNMLAFFLRYSYNI